MKKSILPNILFFWFIRCFCHWIQCCRTIWCMVLPFSSFTFNGLRPLIYIQSNRRWNECWICDSSHQNIRIYADISMRTRFNSSGIFITSIWFIYFIQSISNFVWKSEIVTAFSCVHLHVRVCGVCSCERERECARNEYTDLIPIEGGML